MSRRRQTHAPLALRSPEERRAALAEEREAARRAAQAFVAEHGAEAVHAAAAYLAVGDATRAGWARTTLAQAAAAAPWLRVAARRGRPRKPRPPPRPRGRPRRALDLEALWRALRAANCSMRAAAVTLGVGHSTVARRVAQLGLAPLLAYSPALSLAHARLLAAGGCSPAVANARGYHTVPAGLAIPVWSPRGVHVWTQTRLDAPRGHRRRFQNSPGATNALDTSPAGRLAALDPQRRLYLTEGPRKADTAISRGLACVAACGVLKLCLDDAEWDYVGIAGREVVIAFDGDAARLPEVAERERAAAEYLARRGARVRVARLPDIPRAGGLDDFLVAGGSEAELLALTQRWPKI